MVPVCEAARLSLPSLFLFILFLTFVIHETKSLLKYDRQTLLDLQPVVQNIVSFRAGGSNPCPQLYRQSRVTCTGFLGYLLGEGVIVAGVNEVVGW